MWRIGALCFCACSFGGPQLGPIDGAPPPDRSIDSPPDGPGRVRAGLMAFYAFNEQGGTSVLDTAGVDAPFNLGIGDVSKVTWGTQDLSINLTGPVEVDSVTGPNRINLRAIQTGAITVEAWVESAVADQNGTGGNFARVATMSINSASRNFAIGQQGTMWAAQARTANPGVDPSQGTPALLGSTVVTTVTHLVLTVDNQTRKLYVNGDPVATDMLGGTFSNWSTNLQLSVGAEPSLNNAWKGSIKMLALYDRVLSPTQIQNNFVLGADAP